MCIRFYEAFNKSTDAAFIKCDMIFLLPPFLAMRVIPENELHCLSEMSLCPVACVFAAFSTTGFDRHTSLVFNPANPETSVEDCLAAVGDQVARELDTHLAAAVDTLLAGSVFSCLTSITDGSSHGSTAAFLDCFQMFNPKLKCHIETELWGSVKQLHYSVLIAILHATLFSHYIHTIWGNVCAHRVRVTISEEWQSQCWCTAA